MLFNLVRSAYSHVPSASPTDNTFAYAYVDSAGEEEPKCLKTQVLDGGRQDFPQVKLIKQRERGNQTLLNIPLSELYTIADLSRSDRPILLLPTK